jgi:palmitoyltransferase
MGERSQEVESSVMGARIFYFLMFGLFYACVALYPNKLKQSVVGFSLSPASNLVWLIYVAVLQVTATWYFLTAGQNPGFVQSSKTVEQNIEEAKHLSAMNTDEESHQDLSGFDNVPISLSIGSNLKNMIEMSQVRKIDSSDEKTGMIKQPVTSMGHTEPMKMPPKRFCNMCNIEQPYRSRHCHDCGQCVRKFDHHCFWIGGCVGELNHGKFWLFLFFQTWV